MPHHSSLRPQETGLRCHFTSSIFKPSIWRIDNPRFVPYWEKNEVQHTLFTQASCEAAVVTISIFYWHKGNTEGGGGTSPTPRFHLGKTVFVLMLNFPPTEFPPSMHQIRFSNTEGYEVRENRLLKNTPEIKSTNKIHFFKFKDVN